MKCIRCKSEVVEKEKQTSDGVSHKYYSCISCGQEFLDMNQLHEVAEKYRQMKAHRAKISKWGDSLAIRIPKELAKEYALKPDKYVHLIREKKAIRIMADRD